MCERKWISHDDQPMMCSERVPLRKVEGGRWKVEGTETNSKSLGAALTVQGAGPCSHCTVPGLQLLSASVRRMGPQ